MTFANRLEELLAKNKLSGRKLAEKIGVTTGTVSGWREGSFPTADKAVKIAEIFDTTVEYLVKGEEPNLVPDNYFLVPILDQKLSAGHGEELPSEEVLKGFLEIPKRLTKRFGKNIAMVFVHGDSMEPTLYDGDAIICDTLGYDNSEGIYAIRMNGCGFIKRIQMGNNKILVKSDNRNYDTIEVPFTDETFEIIGKLQGVFHFDLRNLF